MLLSNDIAIRKGSCLALLAMTREGHGEMTPWEEVALKQREGGRGQRKRKMEKEEGGE